MQNLSLVSQNYAKRLGVESANEIQNCVFPVNSLKHLAKQNIFVYISGPYLLNGLHDTLQDEIHHKLNFPSLWGVEGPNLLTLSSANHLKNNFLYKNVAM